MSLCSQTQAFYDGRLGGDEADRQRAHLATCPRCQGELHDLVQLGLLADELVESGAWKPEPRLRLAGPGARPRRRWGVAMAAAALAASIAIAVGVARRWRPADREEALLVELASAPTRPLEARFSRREADHFRRYAPDLAPAAPARMPLKQLAALEDKGDLVGVATAFALAGDFARADALLERVPRAPSVDSDRAAVALQRGKLEEALIAVDAALAQSPDSSQALWNRGLILRDLGLDALAADSFARVAKLGEPGWSEEARERSEQLANAVSRRRDGWLAANAAGRAMVRDGTPIPVEQAAARPGIARLYLYHAVRAAPSRDRVRALLPTAIALDQATGEHVLERYVERVAEADWRTRTALSRTYLDMYLDPGKLDAAAKAAWLDRIRRAGQDDLLLGALMLTDALPAQLPEYRKLADAGGDPWMQAVAVEETAKAAVARGELLDAERQLVAALPACHRRGIEYRCGYLSRQLAELYSSMYRFSEARSTALAGWEQARRGNEWGFEAIFLQDLAWASADHRSIALARAYLDETERRQLDNCEVERYVRLRQARLSVDELQPERARAQLGRAPLCDQPLPLGGVEALAILAHWKGTAAETDQARAALASLRSRGMRPGERAIADELEGRLTVERDAASGRALLDRAIGEAEALPSWDTDATEARSFSYAALIAEAGRAAAWDDALSLFARESCVEPPSRCALGVAVDYDRLIVAARGADGHSIGSFHEAGALPEMAHLVPDAIKAALAACPAVDVFARPPLQGHADLLPRELAWRYRVGRPSPAPPPLYGARRLVVTGVEPPPSLGLPKLRPWSGAERAEPDETLVLLDGAAATPSRVLAEMRRAGEIEFHAHGLVDLGVSEVSLLALSPDGDGRYALTAGEVRKQRLEGAPLVVLAACRAAEAAPYRHRPWSLPVAFVEAGARAVLASPAPLSDGEAEPFFRSVRARIKSGQPAAIALRDARMEWASRDPHTTVQSVLLFE